MDGAASDWFCFTPISLARRADGKAGPQLPSARYALQGHSPTKAVTMAQIPTTASSPPPIYRS